MTSSTAPTQTQLTTLRTAQRRVLRLQQEQLSSAQDVADARLGELVQQAEDQGWLQQALQVCAEERDAARARGE